MSVGDVFAVAGGVRGEVQIVVFAPEEDRDAHSGLKGGDATAKAERPKQVWSMIMLRRQEGGGTRQRHQVV